MEMGESSQRAGQARIASRDDLPARLRGVLDELAKALTAHFEPALHQALLNFEQNLFKTAEQARTNPEQESCYASMREVKRHRGDAGPRLAAALEALLARFDRDPALDSLPDPDSTDRLELVHEQTLELDLALRDIANRAEVHAAEPLFELAHRMAVLACLPVFETEQVPIGPHAVTHCLQEALAPMDLPTEHRVMAWRTFEKYALRDIRAFYEKINQALIRLGILPHLLVYRTQRRPGSEPVSEVAENKPDAASQPAAEPGRPLSSEPESEQPPLFDTLRELLAQRRDMLGGGDEPSGHSFPVDPEQIQDALTSLQNKPVQSVMQQGKPIPRDMQHLRQDLLAQLRRFSPHGEAPRLAPVQRDTVDLVSMLFDHLDKDVHMGNATRSFLSKLQVPLLRVALLDSDFFSKRDHPARQFLNTVTETAAYWMDSTDGEADPSLVQKMHRVTDQLVHEFDGDISLFAKLLDDLQRHMQTLARRAETAEKRYVEAAQGKDRLDMARTQASQAIQERLAGTRIPNLLRALLEQTWTDALALAILRHGQDSDAYRQRLQIADDLLLHKQGQPSEKLCAELEHGLIQVGMASNDAEQVARKVLDEPVTDFSGESVSQTEIAMRLKQRQRLGDAQDQHPRTKPVEAPLTSEEQRMLERLKSIPFGSWFEFQRNQQGDVVRRKLAWFSPVTGRCLFVNQRGQRAEECTMQRLARDMVRKQVRIAKKRDESMVDRAWKAIVTSLRKLGNQPAALSPGVAQ